MTDLALKDFVVNITKTMTDTLLSSVKAFFNPSVFGWILAFVVFFAILSYFAEVFFGAFSLSLFNKKGGNDKTTTA